MNVELTKMFYAEVEEYRLVVVKNMELPKTCADCGGCDSVQYKDGSWGNREFFCCLVNGHHKKLDRDGYSVGRPDWCPLADANDMFDELRRWLLENSVKAKDIGPMVASYWAGWGDAVNGVSRKIAAITGSDREPNRCANCDYSVEAYCKMFCIGQKDSPDVNPNDYCLDHKRAR